MDLDLLERHLADASEVDGLLSAIHHERRPILFMVGSALSLPAKGRGPGVPGASNVVQLVRQDAKRNGLDLADLDRRLGMVEEGQRYGVAMQFLQSNLNQDAVNQLVRRAVRRALRPRPAGRRTRDDTVDRNCSGGCWSWHPGVALEQSAQGGQRVDAVLARGRDVGAHGQEGLRAVQGPPAPGDLLLQLDHADVAFGQVIGGWDPQVLQEPQDFAAVDLQPVQQASGR